MDLGKRSVPGKKEYPVQALREGRVGMFRESQGGQRERSRGVGRAAGDVRVASFSPRGREYRAFPLSEMRGWRSVEAKL